MKDVDLSVLGTPALRQMLSERRASHKNLYLPYRYVSHNLVIGVENDEHYSAIICNDGISEISLVLTFDVIRVEVRPHASSIEYMKKFSEFWCFEFDGMDLYDPRDKFTCTMEMDITEEKFFQLSLIEDLGTLEYEDFITCRDFLKKMYEDYSKEIGVEDRLGLFHNVDEDWDEWENDDGI